MLKSSPHRTFYSHSNLLQVQLDACTVVQDDASLSKEEVILTDPLEVICGNPKQEHIVLKVPSQAALLQFSRLTAVSAFDPAKFALKLLSTFYSDEELGESNCTYVEGRKLFLQLDTLFFIDPLCCCH